MDGTSVGSQYAEHVTGADLSLLAAVTGRTPGPEDLPDVLADPQVFEAIFGPGVTAAGQPSSPRPSWRSRWPCTAPPLTLPPWDM